MRNVLKSGLVNAERHRILSVSTMLDKECCERRAGLRIGLILGLIFLQHHETRPTQNNAFS